MADFEVRALEIHSQYAWDFDWVKHALEFIKDHDLNTLILHRNDFIDRIIYPGKYFGCNREEYKNIFERYQDAFRTLYKYTPTRRSGPFQRRAYLKRVLELAGRAGIEVYIENKELYFPGIILEFYSELVKQGKVCPNEPFWWDFTKTKYQEFFEEFPEISGIITAPATGESKVSISSSRCTCELCKNTAKHEWYQKLLMAMYEPIHAAGKKLIVRDFVFNAQAHQEIAATMEQLPRDVIMALKNTPHDYYPTFPDNPRIGNVGDHAQWIEFDTMGQYFGWGIGPSIMTEDLRRRMKLAREKGATGVMLRTDWESLDGHSSFKTLNYLNLYAGAALANHLESDSNGIYQRWLTEQGFYAPALTAEMKRNTARWLEEIMRPTWDVIKRTVFVNDCVFSDSSTIPVSLEHALWLAEEKNSLKDWDQSKETALATDEQNVQRIIKEKDEALAIVRGLKAAIQKGNTGITPEAQQGLSDKFNVFEKYVAAFRAAVHAIILIKYMLEKGPNVDSGFSSQAPDVLKEKLQDLLVMAEELENFGKRTSFQHTVYVLLDPERLVALHDDLVRRLNSVSKPC